MYIQLTHINNVYTSSGNGQPIVHLECMLCSLFKLFTVHCTVCSSLWATSQCRILATAAVIHGSGLLYDIQGNQHGKCRRSNACLAIFK